MAYEGGERLEITVRDWCAIAFVVPASKSNLTYGTFLPPSTRVTDIATEHNKSQIFELEGRGRGVRSHSEVWSSNFNIYATALLVGEEEVADYGYGLFKLYIH